VDILHRSSSDCVNCRRNGGQKGLWMRLTIIFAVIGLTVCLSVSFSHGREPEPNGQVAMDTPSFGTQQSLQPVISVSPDQLISASVADQPLSDVLRAMSEKQLFDMKGTTPYSETISIFFSDLTLEQALKKLMRGYNYVLLNQNEGEKPLLMIMGKSPGPDHTARPAPARQPVAVAPGVKSHYVPPTVANQQHPLQRSDPRTASPGNRLPDRTAQGTSPAGPIHTLPQTPAAQSMGQRGKRILPFAT
jgi:hypothetical protein